MKILQVYYDGHLIFSKLEQHRVPTIQELLLSIDQISDPDY